MAWFIKAGVNEGYPALNGWADEWQTGWTSNDSVRYPDTAWRIDGSTNEGYPWIWYWFKTTQTDTGDMVIGGSQTNYPNGLLPSNRGGLNDQLNNNPMPDNTALITYTNSLLKSAFTGKAMALTADNFFHVLSFINNPDSDAIADANIIQSLYGANVYDGILLCRVYPFDIPGTDGVVRPKIFGKFKLYDDDGHYPPEPGYHDVDAFLMSFNMGSVTPNILQAWEIEGVDYYIYLPYAGIFPIDVRSGETITITLHVDLLTGGGEYILKQNEQILSIYKTQIGFDMPINLSQGQLNSNFVGFVANQITTGFNAVADIVGAINPVAGAVADTTAGAVKTLNQHFNTSSPSIGGNAGNACYPIPRLIVKLPKMFRDGLGYEQVLGANRSTAYVRLNECSGFTKCVNYKCDIIVATDDEKQEIERLMNAGVML